MPAISLIGINFDDLLYDDFYKGNIDFASLSPAEKESLFKEFVLHYSGKAVFDEIVGNPFGFALSVIIGILVAKAGAVAALIAHELTHIAQHKNKEDYKNASRTELEQEAEINELNEKYNPDPLIAKKIGGTEYRFRKSVWRKIVSDAVRGVEQRIEWEEGRMPDNEYLELLLKYQEFMRGDMREWEI